MKNFCRMIITFCLPFLLYTPVWAQHSGPYVGAILGGSALTTAKSSDELGSFSLTFDPALQGGAVLGWDLAPGSSLGEGRIELEYTHRNNALDKVKFVEGSFKGGGNITADSLLINLFGVSRGANRFSPYAGLGIGAVRIAASNLKVTGQPMADDSTVVFAYQLGGGVEIALTDNLCLDLGYRYFSSAKPEFTEASGVKFKMDYISHNAILGLRFGF